MQQRRSLAIVPSGGKASDQDSLEYDLPPINGPEAHTI